MKKEAAYSLNFHEDALDEWHALDGSVKKPLKQLLEKRLIEPFVLGSELTGPLGGCFKIKLRKQGYRLVYTVDLTTGRLIVLAVGKRDDSAAYDTTLSRVELAEDLAKILKAARNR